MTDAALGSLMVRYTDAKRRRATLYTAVQASKSHLHNAERAIWELPDIGDLTHDRISELVVMDYPPAHVVTDQLCELRAACQDFDLARAQLTDAGIDVS